MINRLTIKGYKCIKGFDFKLGSLNLFVGPNASGKSTCLQSILLLKQSITNSKIEKLKLFGSLYDAGLALDILHPESNHEIEFSITQGELYEVHQFAVNRETQDVSTSRYISRKDAVVSNNTFLSLIPVFYLNAERISPKVSYELPKTDMSVAGPQGKNGEYTVSVLTQAARELTIVDGWSDNLILDSLSIVFNKIDPIKTAIHAIKLTQGRLDLVVNEILKWVVPGATFIAEEIHSSDQTSLAFIRDVDRTQTKVRPTHIGFGLTYVLPVITAALSLPKGGVLIVENPEAHLHPFSQSRIGIFLGLIASTGRQVIIETHSDHVVNGIRLAVSKEVLKPEDFVTYFCSVPDNGSNANIKKITCNSSGEMSLWPRGFFDQIIQDLSNL